MNCKGLKGRKYKKCMQAYVKQSTRQFPTFNKETDTVSVTASSNARRGLKLMQSSSSNPKIRKEINASISKPIIVKSKNSKDKVPYKLKTHRKKNK